MWMSIIILQENAKNKTKNQKRKIIFELFTDVNPQSAQANVAFFLLWVGQVYTRSLSQQMVNLGGIILGNI